MLANKKYFFQVVFASYLVGSTCVMGGFRATKHYGCECRTSPAHVAYVFMQASSRDQRVLGLSVLPTKLETDNRTRILPLLLIDQEDLTGFSTNQPPPWDSQSPWRQRLIDGHQSTLDWSYSVSVSSALNRGLGHWQRCCPRGGARVTTATYHRGDE